MNHTCPLCRSYNTNIEGSLGERLHLRCADCGTWFSRKSKKARQKTKERKQARQFKNRLIETE